MKRWPKCIDLVGVELEGRFHSRHTVGGGDWHNDSSVSIVSRGDTDEDALGQCTYCDCEMYRSEYDSHLDNSAVDCCAHGHWIPYNDDDEDGSCTSVGEKVSPALDTWPLLRTWVECNYPFEVNSSCGTHVHVSFKKMEYYEAFMVDGRTRVLVHWFRDWLANLPPYVQDQRWVCQFISRLEERCSYCLPVHCPDGQLYRGNGERYTAINFCAFHKYGTIEFRLLPAFDEPRWCIEAIERLFQYIDMTVKAYKPSKEISIVRRRLPKKVSVRKRAKVMIKATVFPREGPSGFSHRGEYFNYVCQYVSQSFYE